MRHSLSKDLLLLAAKILVITPTILAFAAITCGISIRRSKKIELKFCK